MRRNYSLYCVCLTVFCIFALMGNVHTAPKKGQGGPPKMPAPLVVAEPVQVIKNSATKEFIGHLEAKDEVDLQPRVSGFITGIKFKEGSLVNKGDLLITIEDTAYRAQKIAAKAELDQAMAEFRYAESNYQRKKLLADKKAISESSLEDAERMVHFRKAKCEQEKADLLNAENELSYTKIYAPITGRIGKIKSSLGNYVSLNSPPLAKIVSVDPMLVKFSISERSFQNLFKTIKKLKRNLTINIKLSNGDIYSEKGKIHFFDNVVDDDTGTISVWVKVKNPEMILIPGGYVSALVSEEMHKPIPGVKISAVITDNKGSFVYVLGKNNIPIRRQVKLGDMVGNLYAILEGVSLGETVIIDGTHKVMPGMPVKLFKAAKVTSEKNATNSK